jgi:GNAT superfamily N-acetyltransferase
VGSSTEIRELVPEDLDWVGSVSSAYFGSPLVVSRGMLHDTSRLPGMVALTDGTESGLLQYRTEGEEFEVVILIALQRRRGIGRALLERAKDIARRSGSSRMWLITTNDNLEAQQFYRAVGWSQARVHYGAIADSRRLKPEIPMIGLHGIPIEDEVEFEFRLE